MSDSPKPKIVIKPSTATRIVDTGKKMRKLSQEDFAKALGATPFTPTTAEEKARYLRPGPT